MLTAAPRRTRRHTVCALTALTLMAGLAYAAQATQAGAAASDDALVEIKMTMSLSNGESRQPRVITKLGLPATIEWGWDTPERSGGWGMVVTVTREPDGRLRTLTRYSEGHPFEPVAGEHTAIGNSGEAIELQRRSQIGGLDLKVNRVVTLLPAGDKPSIVTSDAATEQRRNPQTGGVELKTNRVVTLLPDGDKPPQ